MKINNKEAEKDLKALENLADLDSIPEDSFLWVAEESSALTELRAANPMIQGGELPSPTEESKSKQKVNGQQQTLYQQILLILLPLVLIPFGMSGWMVVTKIAQEPVRSGENVSQFQQHDKLWWQSFISLMSIGTLNLGAALWLARRLSTSFDLIAIKLNEAAHGDLLTKLEYGDNAQFQEVADNFNQLVTNFNQTLQQQGLTAQANNLFGKVALIAQESLDPIRAYDIGVLGVRKLLNTDRVSVYRCEPDWSGVVVAESVETGYKSTLTNPIGRMYFAESPTELERYQQGKGVVIDDLDRVQLSPERRKLVTQLQARSWMLFPIFAHKQLIGLLSIQECSAIRHWESSRHWESWEVDFCTQTAQRLGLAVEQIGTWTQQAAEIRRTNMLSQALQIRDAQELTNLIDRALDSIRQEFNLDRVIIISCSDRESGTIVGMSLKPGCVTIEDEYLQDYIRSEIKHGGDAARQINSIYDLDRTGGLDAKQISLLENQPVRASIVTPIVFEGQWVGLTIGHMAGASREWQQSEVDKFAVVASQIGLALHQSKLVTERENNARRSQILSNFTLQLRQSLRRKDILTTAVELVRQTMDLDRAVVFELDANFNGKIIAESVSLAKFSILNESIEDCCIKDVGYESGHITAFPDIYKVGLSDCHIEMLEKFQVRANLVVPITIDSQLFGLLIGHQCQSTRFWKQEEINLFNQLATQLALALNQSLLIDQREATAKRSQLLSDITLKLRQSIDQSALLNLALPEIRQGFELNRASILVVDADGTGKIIAESIDSPENSILHIPFSPEHLAEIRGLGFDQGNIIVAEDIFKLGLSESLTTFLTEIGLRAAISVPILSGGKLFGLLTCSICDAPRSWEQMEVDLIIQIATQIGDEIDRAELVSQLEIANLQQAKYATSQQTAKESLQTNAWEMLLQIDRISQGDLTIRARVTDDEIGTIADSYNATVESLRKLVSNVQNVSQEVVRTTRRNEISVVELSVDALQQAEEVGLALTRLQDMSRSIQLVVNNALIAESAMMESAQLVQDGDAAMNRTVEGILTIRNTVAETAKKVKRLGESSQKISKVVSLISNFAAQTNLLALNASIEAARAGEEGRGFAVVAEEVRSLARQSAEATGEIEKLVASIQAETNDVVTAMEAGTEQVAIGTKLVDETRSSLNRIAATSAQIGKLVEAIAQAALLQSEDSTQVTQSIDRVATIANKTSSRADNVQVAFQDLLKLARELQTNIGQFKIE
jgi:methyl-accepting chemotaxis protein PixJ